MINGEKIGVGVITCNRENLFQKCWGSLQKSYNVIDAIIVINDGKPHTVAPMSSFGNENFIQHKQNIGVGKSKNEALQFLLNHGCEHIFLIEDDIFIEDSKVFEKYIEASKITGIQHFNYSQHGRMNKTYGWGIDTPVPNPRVVIDYGKITLPLYPHCVGAFSYYSRKCLETTGLMDERYYNACEHVDHTLEIIKKGMHPPFWYFADIEMSWTYLGDEEWSIKNSTISSNPNHQQMMKDADVIFRGKHGYLPGEIPLEDIKCVGKALKEVKKTYGRSDDSNL